MSQGIVYIIDDDPSILGLVEASVRAAGLDARTFGNAEQFAGFRRADQPSCILLDLEMPGISGLEFLERQFKGELPCPVIILTGHASVQAAVKSMKLGAVDFLEKPFDRNLLVKLVTEAIAADKARRAGSAARDDVRGRLASLSPRERELLAAVIEGKSTKMIADELGISARTVDHHRANLMEKMHAANVADLVRMAVETGFNEQPKTAPPPATPPFTP